MNEIKKKNAPVVVGLDPNLSMIPDHIMNKAIKEYGETLEAAAEAVFNFNKGIIDTTYDLIPAVKPQIAMYEQFGVPGVAAYKRTVDYAKSSPFLMSFMRNYKVKQHIERYFQKHTEDVKLADKDLLWVNPEHVNAYLPLPASNARL